jgi:hypothetical protein
MVLCKTTPWHIWGYCGRCALPAFVAFAYANGAIDDRVIRRTNVSIRAYFIHSHVGERSTHLPARHRRLRLLPARAASPRRRCLSRQPPHGQRVVHVHTPGRVDGSHACVRAPQVAPRHRLLGCHPPRVLRRVRGQLRQRQHREGLRGHLREGVVASVGLPNSSWWQPTSEVPGWACGHTRTRQPAQTPLIAREGPDVEVCASACGPVLGRSGFSRIRDASPSFVCVSERTGSSS